ncbi:hypothetical protein [Asticcacaulis endophyticus]|uniref:Uncharacterized protein n=1 Tax=Asticcacaulis endophyticus TaxID=1395890 RepID=A0A918Q4K2_9CAUL|nr:hypothetical protein [Asticcacaulis endophyticus]GGZ31817.1 hypothetical protein GCM10011273_17260 [Asticcacaulis endophyticus]
MTAPYCPAKECTLCGDEAAFFGQDDWNMCRACHARFTAQQSGIVQPAVPPEKPTWPPTRLVCDDHPIVPFAAAAVAIAFLITVILSVVEILT